MIQVPRQAPCSAVNLILPLHLPLSLMVYLSSLFQINKWHLLKETNKLRRKRNLPCRRISKKLCRHSTLKLISIASQSYVWNTHSNFLLQNIIWKYLYKNDNIIIILIILIIIGITLLRRKLTNTTSARWSDRYQDW